jgi:hypothetical protein
MEALNYEHFVRGAFTLALNTDVERGADPAGLAEAGLVNMNSLSKIKVGTCYAMEVLSNYILNNIQPQLTDSERNLMDSLIDDVLNATNVQDINTHINQYKQTFFTHIPR